MSRVYDNRFGVPISGNGFYAEYFAVSDSVRTLADIDFDAAPDSVGAVDSLDYRATDAAFWMGGPTDFFAARYTSELSVETGGTYTFFLNSDDGSALFIDGQKVIDNDGRHATTQREVTIDLGAGTHEIDLQYFEAWGDQTLQMRWSGPDTNDERVSLDGSNLAYQNVASVQTAPTIDADISPVVVDPDQEQPQENPTQSPTAELVVAEPETLAVSGGLRADFFVLERGIRNLGEIDFDADPAHSETVDMVRYLKTRESFWDGGPRDNFAARFTGDLNVETAGEYTFHLISDDGSALYLNGERVIGNDGLHGRRKESVTLELDSGEHDIEIRYFESGGDQVLRLRWQGPDSDGKTVEIQGASLSHRIEAVPVIVAEESEPVVVSEPAVVPEPIIVPEEIVVAEEDVAVVTPPVAQPTDTAEDQGDTAGTAGLRADFFVLDRGIRNLGEIDFNADPVHSESIDSVRYTRTQDSFWDGGSTDNFAARLTGDLNVESAGEYTFYLNSDDGSALYLDGERVIGNDGLHAARTETVTLDLDAGQHDIEIRYFESGGDQVLRLRWQGPDSDGLIEDIQGASLSHALDGDGMADPAPVNIIANVIEEPINVAAVPDAPINNVTADDPVDQTDQDLVAVEMDHAAMTPVNQPVTTAEIEDFVAAARAEPDGSAHGDNPEKAMEHMQLLDLVPRSDATHVAISDGDWFDPNTWYEGRIPSADAKVLIPSGVSVTYDGESNASLFTVRVDGELSFATDSDSKLVVDTLVVSASGRLEIGTADNPIDANVNVDIVIANNGDIDVNWDPSLLSRGIVAHGQTEIHGAEKDAFLKVSDAPMAGDTSLSLAEVPGGWQVGDTIVVTGTHKTGWTGTSAGHIESQDEEVTITAINGNRISFDRALEYDHDTPRDDLFAYVANTSRNITVRSEDGDATEVNHRGHVMFMHNDDVDVRYAAFDDLGRTDKSVEAFDVESLSTVNADSNIKGRYSFHFHQTGTADQDDPAMAVGNAVSGGPGWGFAHHSSNANFTDNVAFDVFGAGFAAESGDETGVWIGNMAIKSEGIGFGAWSAKQGGDVARQDTGRTGDGFFFAGRLVEAAENVAVNTTNGFVWMHRNAESDPLAANLDHPEIAYGSDTLAVNRGPIQGFQDNEAFGTHTGLMVIKANAVQETHDMRSVFDGFVNWETVEGADISYTAHYTMLDFDLISARDVGGSFPNAGITLATNTYDMVMNGLKLEGFDVGVDLDQTFHFAVANQDVNHVIIDMETIDVGTALEGFDRAKHQLLTSDDLTPGRLDFTLGNDASIGRGENFSLDGVRTDSIGTMDRAAAHEPLDLEFYKEIITLIAEDGYYKTEDGRNVLLIDDYITDRATGDLLKMTHVVTIEMTDQELASNWMINNTTSGAKFNGMIDLSGVSPTARADTATTAGDDGVIIDVLANDFDRDGGAVNVDGFTDPEYGDVYLQENGELLYKPNVGFTGSDTFNYWAADDSGQFSQATVTVDVWE